MNIGFISLGCSKNLVDTEMCIGIFKSKNYNIVNDPKEADVIIINTCGFIESAKEEGINTILEMAEYKRNGKCKALIVMGCLVERYKDELQKAIPEVDLFIAIREYDKIEELILNKIEENYNSKLLNSIELNYHNRVITTGSKTAYLKIAEGCSNRCTYCAIPYIRGPFISRDMQDILKEAEELAEKGYEEIIVIAQDTTKYGIDLYGESKLAELLEKLCTIEKIKWIRFLYAYPESITDELIEVVKNNDKICKYFDIPIQHISDKILKVMNRKSNEKQIKNLINKIRSNIPDVIIRTSLIVGFPGESKEDFEKLYNFLNEAKLDKVGVFKYSKEDGTPAAKLKNQIHGNTKNSRYNRLMKLQQEISKNNLQEKIGEKYVVLIENKTSDGKYYIARSYMDVPDMDGVIFIKNSKNINLGEFTECIATDVIEYDFIAEFI